VRKRGRSLVWVVYLCIGADRTNFVALCRLPQSVYIKILRLIWNVGNRAYAMSHAAAERLAAGRGTGIGLQYVNDDQSARRDKPKQI